ncbi:MAG: DUF4142 domain-containing protein [Acidobacteriaceae bacterium]|nr:DUF4142 domain-containing protein [Acidobacteriaceae bacterium]
MDHNFRKYLTAGSITGALLFFFGVANAQNDNATHMDTSTQKMLSSADTTFATKAAQGGLAEVQLGQLAVSKAESPSVKEFGQKMVDDHTKANDQLKQLAQQQNMTLPATMNAKDQALYDKLQKLSGAQFDKMYMKAMVKDHEEDVKEFQKEATHGKDSAIKNFASQTLPILEQHLQMAKSTDSQVASAKS